MSDTSKLLRTVRSQGASVESGGGHHKIRHPATGKMVSIASTPGDKRSMLNARAELRRAGFTL